MKKEMEKSFKSLSEGRAAGIKEVQKDVLGVTDEESDKLMDRIITDDTSAESEADTGPISSLAEDEPGVLNESVASAVEEK